MKLDIENTLRQLTLEEKASLCSGLGYWDTKPVQRLGIEPFVMTDGPHGVRMQEGTNDRFGLNESAKATCFPTGSCLASSWDSELLAEVGAAIGQEARAKNVALVLGPAINMKRSPLCGRNFEYLSEDPLLAGKLGAAYVAGMQAQGVGACPKHFAANNQERRRQTIDTRVDERTLREIYLRVFEIVIRESAPWMLMSSYNKINGTFASENKRVLKDILRDEWGYEGLAVTDWYGNNDRVAGVAAGQDLEMPGEDGLSDAQLVEAVRAGTLAESAIDDAVRNFLRLYNRLQDAPPAKPVDFAATHATARRAATESAVLLKNKDGLLPLSSGQHVAVIGAFAKTPRYQGGGSSHMNANQMDVAWDCMLDIAGEGKLSYSPGYDVKREEPDAALIAEAVENAKNADVAVVFCGLTDDFESEGFDRETLAMPKSHTELLKAVGAANPNTVAVLQNGAPVEMPWLPGVGAVLECYLGGEAGGSAAADLLYGRANPCGKLAETFPHRLQDNPSYLNFPGCKDFVEYREGIFIGYRHYASAGIRPLFPFGHGLSYTSFAISTPMLGTGHYARGDAAPTLRCRVKNTGGAPGKEVVQVYVQAPGEEAVRPRLELKGFAKVSLAPGEETAVEIPLADLSYWNDDTQGWELESGPHRVYMGNSSDSTVYCGAIEVQGTVPPRACDNNTMLGDLLAHETVGAWARHIRHTFTVGMTGGIKNTHTEKLLEVSTLELPLRVLLYTGYITPQQLAALLAVLNGQDTTGMDLSFLQV